MAEVINPLNDRDSLADGLQSLKTRWRRLSGDSRSVLVIALLAAIIAAATVVVLWTSSRQFLPLYGNQEQYDKAVVLDTLEKEGIDFRLDQNNGNILIAEEQLANARMRLAARGVKAALPPGMDDLKSQTGLGTSQFMETAQYTHAIEGELARTIIALDAVRSARVHLAIPKRTLFVGRDEQQPSAAVMVDLVKEISQEQVEAMINLVAGSVSGLEPSAVSVIDQNGDLLSAGMNEKDQSARLSNKQMDYTSRLEARMINRAQAMLLPLLGYGNFRVQVAADVDFTDIEKTQEALEGDPVLIREQTKDNRSTDRIALGIPGSLSNEPPVAQPQQAQPQQAQANAQPAEQQNNDNTPRAVNQRSENSRQYQTGRAVTHTQFAPGRVSHLSVSVLLNNAKAPEGGWPQDQLEQIGQMVRAAVGFDEQRGDMFSLQSFNFTAQEGMPAEPPKEQWWQQPVWQDYLRYVLGGLMLLLLIVFGIRPLVQHLVRSSEPEVLTPERDLALLNEEQQGEQELAEQEEDDEAQMLASLPPPGSELEVQVKHLQLLVDKETVRVAEVIKQWMNGDEPIKN